MGKKTSKANGRQWKLVTDTPITEYRCGAKAGERVRLKKEIVVLSKDGKPTGEVHRANEIWMVTTGSSSPPPGCLAQAAGWPRAHLGRRQRFLGMV